jgi:hypothetical protein
LSGYVAIKQYIVSKAMSARRRMQGFLDAIDRAKRETRSPSTEDQWCHHNVEPVEASCLDEARKSIRTSFHEHASDPELGQGEKNARRGDLPIFGLQKYGFNSPHSEGGSICTHHYRSALLAAQACAVRESPPRVHYDTYGIGAADTAHSQLRIVSASSLDADKNSINEGSQAVKMFKRGRAVDVMRAPGSSCHSAIE